MAVFQQSEDRARIKRIKAEQAVSLAIQNRWAEAVELNRQIIDGFPKDVEAHNRLGRALMELGRFDEAREAYNHTLRVDPTNTIAQKNLQRLDKLMAESVAVDTPTVLDPSLFIAETGRATTTTLVQPATPEQLAKMHAGDPVNLDVQENFVSVTSPAGEALGRIEPKLRQRIIRLVGMGNQYAAHVTAVDDESVKIIVRETRRDPSMGNRPSFPATGDPFRGYVRDSLLRYDEEEEDLELDEVERERGPEAAGEDLLLSDLPGESPDEDEESS